MEYYSICQWNCSPKSAQNGKIAYFLGNLFKKYFKIEFTYVVKIPVCSKSIPKSSFYCTKYTEYIFRMLDRYCFHRRYYCTFNSRKIGFVISRFPHIQNVKNFKILIARIVKIPICWMENFLRVWLLFKTGVGGCNNNVIHFSIAKVLSLSFICKWRQNAFYVQQEKMASKKCCNKLLNIDSWLDLDLVCSFSL